MAQTSFARLLLCVAAAGLLLLGLFANPATADISLGSSDSGTGTVTTNLAALVDLTISDATIALGQVDTGASGVDTFDDSRGANEGASDSIALSNINSNVNVGAYFDRDSFTNTVNAIGSAWGVVLTGVDYSNLVSATPKGGQHWNASLNRYTPWTDTDANDAGLYIFFDDGYEEGTANLNNEFSLASGSASTYNAADFTPYIFQVNATNHKVGLPDSNPEMPATKWVDATSVTTSDDVFEGVMVYYNESATPGSGTEGQLRFTYVQVVLKADGSAVMCREGGASTAGGDWSALTGWDRARAYDGTLNGTYKAPDTSCTIKGNRYVPSYTVTTGGSEEVVLSMTYQLRLNIGSYVTGNTYAALAFPKEAPRADYTWIPTINAVNWSPTDAQSNTADDHQYP